MTYRGVYRDGIIVPTDLLDLPDGARLSFSIMPQKSGSGSKRKAAPRRKGSKKKSSRMTSVERVAAFMKGFGVSREVPEWKGKSTGEIARQLRTAALGNWGDLRGGRHG